MQRRWVLRLPDGGSGTQRRGWYIAAIVLASLAVLALAVALAIFPGLAAWLE
jgi:hypothetical protein